jgi:hypothetical protein
MLDKDAAGRLISAAKLSVKIPKDWTDFFQKSGPIATQFPEHRQHLRFFLRTAAAIVVESTLPAFPRAEDSERVFTKDISRAAIAFLHGEQLFPGERVRVTLANGQQRETKVSRCRRIDVKCWEIAAKCCRRAFQRFRYEHHRDADFGRRSAQSIVGAIACV